LVTVGRFRQFVNAVLPPDGGVGWLPSAGSGKHSHLNSGLGLVSVGGDAGLAYEPGWVTSENSNIAPTNTNLACNPTWQNQTWTNTAGSQENLPINCVNWWESVAFCIWDGGFLPSEAEWEYAAHRLRRSYGRVKPGARGQRLRGRRVVAGSLVPQRHHPGDPLQQPRAAVREDSLSKRDMVHCLPKMRHLALILDS
jgi:formylglycine-generating enzyme required for sulfatase activity